MTTAIPYLFYADCEAALDFLGRAFGFDEVLRYSGEAGYVNHAELRLGEARVMIGDPGDDYRPPRELGGATFGVYVNVEAGVDELCERARAAGAEIAEEPADQDYGERRFTARDPEGHLWFFGQTIRDLAPEDWGATPAAS